MSTSDIPGKWQLKESQNFDEFMAALGVSYLVRKLGNASKPLLTITELAPKEYSIKQESLVKTSETKFKIDQPFDETTADGRLVKSVMTLEKPNLLVHDMKGTGGGKDSICWREFFKDHMKCTCKVDDIVTVRLYDRVQS